MEINNTLSHYQKYKDTIMKYREDNRDKYNKYMREYNKKMREELKTLRQNSLN